jgi:hypothetical protein
VIEVPQNSQNLASEVKALPQLEQDLTTSPLELDGVALTVGLLVGITGPQVEHMPSVSDALANSFPHFGQYDKTSYPYVFLHYP